MRDDQLLHPRWRQDVRERDRQLQDVHFNGPKWERPTHDLIAALSKPKPRKTQLKTKRWIAVRQHALNNWTPSGECMAPTKGQCSVPPLQYACI